MGGILTIVVLLACLLLILFVLVQNPKGGGLNSEFGSAVQLGGAKRATDILEKGTWGLAIGIAAICLIMAAGGNSIARNNADGDSEIEVTSDGIETDGGVSLPTGGNPSAPSPGGGLPQGN